jgi:predicted Zn-dependent protease
VLISLGRPEEALDEFGAALAEVPGSTEARLGEVEALLEAGRWTQAMERVEPLLSAEASTPDAWTLAALCARAAGSPGDARLLLARARERASGAWVAPHRSGRLAELGASLGASGVAPPGTAA